MAESWSSAWQTRCCPPDAVIHGETDNALAGHLEICPVCREKRNNPLPEIRLQPFTTTRDSKQSPRPCSGEIWTVAARLGGWGLKKRYYNPPVVLILTLLETDSAESDIAHVAQIFSDCSLAGADDLPLDNDFIGFVQPWNRYTLELDALDICLGKVSTTLIVELNRKLAADAVTGEDTEAEPGSLLWFFRNMEVETGWFFAQQSIAGILEKNTNCLMEKDSAQSLAYSSTAELFDALTSLRVIIPDSMTANITDNASALAAVLPADDLLPMAAADKESAQGIDVLVFMARQGKIEKAKVVQAVITQQEEKNSIVYISGQCEYSPGSNSEWLFFWKIGNQFQPPIPGQYGVEEGIFWAMFSLDDLCLDTGQEKENGELLIRLVELE